MTLLFPSPNASAAKAELAGNCRTADRPGRVRMVVGLAVPTAWSCRGVTLCIFPCAVCYWITTRSDQNSDQATAVAELVLGGPADIRPSFLFPATMTNLGQGLPLPANGPGCRGAPRPVARA